MRRNLAALSCFVVTAGCDSGTPTSPIPVDAERLTMRIQTSHFQVLGGASPDATLRGAADSLEGEYENGGTQIYQLGYLLGEFIVSRYGRASYLRLIQTNADIPGVLGISTADFEAAWQSYLRQRYLS